MKLPFILDVALGLIFIYLIFSLLASELQELLATLLQWRAEHLRKSIEILLAGDVKSSEDAKVIYLANRIYSNPIIKSINQEAKGFLSTLPRKFTWSIASIFSLLQKSGSRLRKETIFGDANHSAPSYIPADAFAATLLDSLNLHKIVHKLRVTRLEKLQEKILNEVKRILLLLENQIKPQALPPEFIREVAQDFDTFKKEYNQTLEDFKSNKIHIDMSITRMRDSLDEYLVNFQANADQEQDALEKTCRRLNFLRKEYFDNIEQTIMIYGLKPNIQEIVDLIKKGSDVHEEIMAAVQDKDSETYKTIQGLIESLPESLVSSISVIAKRAQLKAKTTEEGINLLRQEIEKNFDSSMERAAGVYKRNAKGVAILIGITLAVGANADTFHIIDRLAKDSILRDALVVQAIETRERNSDSNTIDANEILKTTTLPIGWSEENLKNQLESPGIRISGWPVFNIFKMLTGWLVTGLAIAMGAPFWFDLLGKVMNVRNVGKKPKQKEE
jgi:phosphohistidine swiveling domain-containing protein